MTELLERSAVDDAPRAATPFHGQRGIENGRSIEVLDEAHAAALIGAAHVVEYAVQRHAALVYQRHVVQHSLHLVEQVRRGDHRAPVIGHGANDGVEDVATQTFQDLIEARRNQRRREAQSALHGGMAMAPEGNACGPRGTGLFVAGIAGFFRLDEIAELANAGTLLAFIAVAACMMILRKRSPDLPRIFRCPQPYVVGTLAIAGCLYLIFSLPSHTLSRFLIWNLIGIGVYLVYGRARSLVSKGRMAVER